MRRIRRLALVLLGLAVAVALALLVASRTGVVRELARRQVVTLLRDALDAEVTVGRTEGTIGRSLVLDDLRVAVDGHTVLAVPRTEIVYALGPLLRRRLRLRRVTLIAPRVDARRSAAGWRLPTLRARGASGSSSFTVEIDRLEVRAGRIGVSLADASPPRRFAATDFGLTAAATFAPDHQSIRLDSLDVVPRGIALTPLHAHGEVATSAGTLLVRDLDVATSRSRLVGRARIERGQRLDAHLLFAPIDAREVRAVVPDLRLRPTLRAIVVADGPWNAVGVGVRASFEAGGRARAAGTLDLGTEPVAYDARLRATGLDPAAIIDGLVSADVNGHARVRGQGLGIRAPVDYALKLDGSQVDGQRIHALTLRGHTRDGTHDADLRLAVPAGTLVSHARVALGPRPRYRLTGRVTAEHLEELIPSLPGRGAIRVSAAGAGLDAATRRVGVRGELTGAELRGVALERGHLRARLRGEDLRVTALDLEGPALRASGSGTLDLHARLAEGDAQAEAQLAPLLGVSAGSATLQAKARGPLDGLAVAATVALRDLDTPRAGVERADATLELGGLGGSTPSGRAHLDASGVRVDTGVPRDGSADATWRRSAGGDVADVTLTGRRAGEVTERLVAVLTRSGPRTAGTLRELQVTFDEQPPWQLGRPASFELIDGSLTTPGLVLASGEQQVSLAGRIGVRGPLDAALETTRLRVALLCALAPGPPCDGELGGRLALAGTAADPRLTGTFTAAGVRVDAVEYGDVHLALRYAERRAVIDAALRHPAAGELHLDGSVPVDLGLGPRVDLSEAPVDLRLHAARLDLTFLRALSPHELRQSAGRLELDVRVTGPRAAPRTDGRLALKDGRLELAAAGLPYEDVQADLALAGDAVEIRQLHARAGDGTLEGTGRLGILGERSLDISVRIEDFLAVRRETVEAQASGALTVRGTLEAPEVRGTLDVNRGVVRPTALPVSGPSLERDATIAVTGRPEPSAEGKSTPASELGKALGLDVEVRIVRNVWIRRADANIELGGALRLEKASGQPPRVSGTIRLVRGWYAFQGRRFDIDEGTIRFTGNVPPQPVFDITAWHRAGEYRIVVHVQGSSAKPTLTLTSEPPLEQADILSVLLFGKPTTQLGRGESVNLQRQALELASGYVAPELRTSVMNTLGLDVLDVALQGNGTDNAPRVTVGRYVSSDVFVSLAQEFGSRAAQVVGIEYGLTPRVSVKGSTSTRGDSAIDLFWHHRY